jgi:hypothetical protein
VADVRDDAQAGTAIHSGEGILSVRGVATDSVAQLGVPRTSSCTRSRRFTARGRAKDGGGLSRGRALAPAYGGIACEEYEEYRGATS